MIYKGTESDIDHYSCFWDNQQKVPHPACLTVTDNNRLSTTNRFSLTFRLSPLFELGFPQHATKLRAVLLGRDIMDVYIAGLATDVCVGGSHF